MFLSGPPKDDVVVPAAVTEQAGSRAIRVVWRNELGGLTFEVGTGDDRCFVKWAPAGSGLDFTAEADRMAWAAPMGTTPRVIAQGSDATGAWLTTAPVPGESAVSDRWRADPATAVAAIGAGLRHLHDHASAATCPFSWSAEDRVARARRRADGRTTEPAGRLPGHEVLSIAEALARLDDVPSVDRLVVCHGDACAPNTMVDHGRWSGHVDLGALGVADRWADLAVATWSTEWNYGPGWERPLLDAYGIDPDAERTAYYRLLWDLS